MALLASASIQTAAEPLDTAHRARQNPRMPMQETNGETLYYEEHGDESLPKLVIIRGLSRSMRFWAPLLPYLEGKYRLLMFDHRGIGRSPIKNKKFNAKDMADDLAGLMRARDFFPAHVFGLSLGGMVAQRLAIHYGELVDKLILGSTTAGGKESVFPRVDSLLMLALYSAALPTKLSVKMQAPRLISRAVAKGQPEIAESWAPFLEQEPLDGKVVLSQALSGAFHNVLKDLPSIKSETLVITGDKDRLISHKNSHVLAKHIPKSVLEILPGRGHDIVAESPQDCADHFERFLLQPA